MRASPFSFRNEGYRLGLHFVGKMALSHTL